MKKLDEKVVKEAKTITEIKDTDAYKAIEYREYDQSGRARTSFDEYDDEELLGVREKRFLRVKNDCIEKLVEDLKDGNTFYISYVNDAIKDGMIPQSVSMLLKDHRYWEGEKETGQNNPYKLLLAEVLVSQILNFYGCPTVFNSAVYTKWRDKKYYKLASLDFLSEGDDFYNFKEDVALVISYSLPQSVDALDKYLERKNEIARDKFGPRSNKVFITREEKEKLIDDFVMSFLVRKIIFKDIDFADRNAGIIYNEKTGEVKFINIDYEYCFDNDICFYGKVSDAMQLQLKYAMVDHNDVYNRFIRKTQELHEVICDYMKTDEFKRQGEDYKTFIEKLETSTLALCEFVGYKTSPIK